MHDCCGGCGASNSRSCVRRLFRERPPQSTIGSAHRVDDQCSRGCDLDRGSRPLGRDRPDRSGNRLRSDRLLKSLGRESGSAPVETVFALAILLFLVLATVQVVLALYGRNVVAASAHEGARAAIELGRSPADAIAVARRTVVRSAGGLVEGLHVGVAVQKTGVDSAVRVHVSGWLKALGPVPLPLPVNTVATSTRSTAPP